MLKALIPQDIANLRSDGYQVFRPAVFFISDGEPTDSDWRDSFRELTDRAGNKRYPNIISFGVDTADAEVIREIGTKGAFLAEAGINPGSALREIMRSLTKSRRGVLSATPCTKASSHRTGGQSGRPSDQCAPPGVPPPR